MTPLSDSLSIFFVICVFISITEWRIKVMMMMMWHIITHIMQPYFLSNVQLFLVDSVDITRHIEADRHVGSSGLFLSDFHWGVRVSTSYD